MSWKSCTFLPLRSKWVLLSHIATPSCIANHHRAWENKCQRINKSATDGCFHNIRGRGKLQVREMGRNKQMEMIRTRKD